MKVVYQNFPIYNSNGSLAGTLDGTYEATLNEDQQPGWHALRKVSDDGSIGDEILATVHIVNGETLA